MTKRHKAILDQLVAAVRPSEGVEVRVNSAGATTRPDWPRGGGPEGMVRCLSDLVIIDRTSRIIKIVDVNVAYEMKMGGKRSGRRGRISMLPTTQSSKCYERRGSGRWWTPSSLVLWVRGTTIIGAPWDGWECPGAMGSPSLEDCVFATRDAHRRCLSSGHRTIEEDGA